MEICMHGWKKTHEITKVYESYEKNYIEFTLNQNQ